MFRNILKQQLQAYKVAAAADRRSLKLQIALWVLLTLCVIGVGYINWHADFVAQRPLNLLGLIIHCTLAGLIGLIVLTKIEMLVEPWRFMD